jgi:hypothetical protein
MQYIFVGHGDENLTIEATKAWHSCESSCRNAFPDRVSDTWSLLALMLSAFAIFAFADDAAPDKTDYMLFNQTPDADLRSFSTE